MTITEEQIKELVYKNQIEIDGQMVTVFTVVDFETVTDYWVEQFNTESECRNFNAKLLESTLTHNTKLIRITKVYVKGKLLWQGHYKTISFKQHHFATMIAARNYIMDNYERLTVEN